VKSPDSSGWSDIPDELLPEAIRLLESSIDELEREKSGLEDDLADPSFYADAARSSSAVERFEQLEVSIQASMQRWEKLAALKQD
jgi:hypothetical protein